MSGKNSSGAPSATPWDGIPDDELTPVESLVRDAARSMYDFRHEPFSKDIDFFNSYKRSTCIRCGGPAVRAGFAPSGLQRYRCRGACKKMFTPVTGTIFESRKLPISAWTDFILQTISFESIASMTREDRRSDTTTPYWMAKLFAVCCNIQDDAVLAGRIQIDETYWPVAKSDAVHREDGKLLRGLSRNQLCIGVGVDAAHSSIFIAEGQGRPTRAKTKETFGSHIARGSTLVHDKERSHRVLIEELSLKDECYNSKLLKGLPDKDNPLNEVNKMCLRVKQFLGSHSGFDQNNLQGFLDVLYVAMNKPKNKLEKVAMLLDRAMCNPVSLRFREFYHVYSRSKNC